MDAFCIIVFIADYCLATVIALVLPSFDSTTLYIPGAQFAVLSAVTK